MPPYTCCYYLRERLEALYREEQRTRTTAPSTGERGE